MRTDPNTYIYKINDNKPKEVLDKNTKYFDKNGKQIKKNINILDVCAKITDDSYFIRVNTRGQVYEPHSEDAILRDKKYAREINLEPDYAYSFRKCDKTCYNHYIKYLETKASSRVKIVQSELDSHNIKTKNAFVMSEGMSQMLSEENGIKRID